MAANYHSDSQKGTHQYKRWYTTNGENGLYLKDQSTYPSGAIGRTTVGSDTPNFQARRRRGDLLPFTAFDQYEYDSTVGTYSYDYRSNTYTATSGLRSRVEGGSMQEPVVPSMQFKADLVSYAGPLQSLAAKANGWDALTFVAEAHQLKSMLLGLVSKVATLVRQRPAKFTVNQWLELRYGWRVLYYDMLSISDAINSLNSKRRFSSYTSGDSFSTETSTTATFSDTRLTLNIKVDTTYSFNIRARLVMLGEVNPIRVNPLATAWELIRFSFVIDWFLSVGKAIDALSLAMSGARYVAGAGYKVEVSSETSLTTALTAGYYFTAPPAGSGSTSNGYCISRSPASIPLMPQWNPRLTSGRIVDLIALILQRALR